MWYEAMPSLAIIGVCMSMPQILIYFTNKIGFGNPYRRLIKTTDDKHNFLRDARLSGTNSPYKQIGLSDFKVDEDFKGGKK